MILHEDTEGLSIDFDGDSDTDSKFVPVVQHDHLPRSMLLHESRVRRFVSSQVATSSSGPTFTSKGYRKAATGLKTISSQARMTRSEGRGRNIDRCAGRTWELKVWVERPSPALGPDLTESPCHV